MTFNKGGRGKKQKTQGIEVFHKMEDNFVKNFSHNISSEIIKLTSVR